LARASRTDLFKEVLNRGRRLWQIKDRPKAVSIFVFELLTLRPANFADGNECQHGKDRKSYHHRATPNTAQHDCIAAAKAFRAQTVFIGLEVCARLGLSNVQGILFPL
jgi:hypothetical protein